MIEQSRETSTAHRSGETVETKLLRIAEKARKEPEFQFTSLFHLMNVELLRGCFAGLKPGKAPGIDQVTKEEYAEDLEGNLAVLVEKLQGHYNYYGVTDNLAGIMRYFEAVKRLLVKWLRRRSQRRHLTWEKFNRMLARQPLPRPRIVRDLICNHA